MSYFNGVFTALVTPFKNQEVDFESLKRLVLFQIERGVRGFVVNGTTAESPTLEPDEVEKIFFFVRQTAGPQVPLIVGVGTNNTRTTIQAAQKAQAWGAEGLLVVTPYYNKPPQRGLLEHFKAVADATHVPNILYNVPGRTVVSLEIETIKKLSEHPQIVAIKEASGKIDFAEQIFKQCHQSLELLSGDDESYEEFLKVGGQGIISVASHLLPQAFSSGQIKAHLPLIKSIYLEANPIPVKMALYLMGQIQSPECRLPLVEASPLVVQKLKEALALEGLIK